MKVPMKNAFRSLTACPSRGYIAGGDEKGRVYFWDSTTGWLLQAWDAHYKAVTAVRFSPDGTFLLTAGADAVVNGWLISDIVLLRPTDAPSPYAAFPANHTLPVQALAYATGGPCALAVSGGLDGVVSVLDVAKKATLGSVTAGSAVQCL
eukprot:CAMPEP_0170189694 /NCGR_PEP_ID=MMETSP0040_2-20121228/47460_1 /TAXON_ID=641309 /ORGANISM="Lotharella oceanica, Strain CCMP622" /LENGTH=149 /DNA_ID=CAMNT_0010437329 /DNA_START=126 /DNA_END=572 /DNA_ORIENTATION=-